MEGRDNNLHSKESGMNHKMILSAVCTCVAIAVPLCLIALQSEAGTLAWDKLFYHILLLLGVAVIYWSVSLMHYMDLKTCNSSTAIEKFSVLMYPMTFLVVLSVLFIGFFSLADEYVRGHVPLTDGPPSLIPWARFGVSTAELFPGVFFPLGVVMYAFWGAFLYNIYNFIRRIIDGDFVPKGRHSRRYSYRAGHFRLGVGLFCLFPRRNQRDSRTGHAVGVSDCHVVLCRILSTANIKDDRHLDRRPALPIVSRGRQVHLYAVDGDSRHHAGDRRSLE